MRGKKRVHDHEDWELVSTAVFYYWYWLYKYILMVIQISYATAKQEESKRAEEGSYSNIN